MALRPPRPWPDPPPQLQSEALCIKCHHVFEVLHKHYDITAKEATVTLKCNCGTNTFKMNDSEIDDDDWWSESPPPG